MNNISDRLVLAIESAVAGGSISLLDGETEVDFTIGPNNVSRAEDLLAEIAALLERNDISKSDISAIAVSTGPGSYTGIRIAISTALGLKNALNIPCFGIPVTVAMAAFEPERRVTTAVPMGRNDVCVQHFESISQPDELRITTNREFIESVMTSSSKYILESSLFALLPASEPEVRPKASLIDAGNNLARYVGLAALKGLAKQTMQPIFVKNAAAPK